MLNRFLLQLPMLSLIGLMGTAVTGAQDIGASADEICPLLPGEQVPEISFTGLAGEAVSLRQELARGPLVLIFYRGGW